MFTYLYNIWIVYRIILHIHGFYVAYSFLCWSLNYTYLSISYFMSYFYNNEINTIKQIEDKK